MNKSTQQHLEKVTVSGLMEFRAEAFISWASAKGAQIGVNAVGQFIVKTLNKESAFNNPAEAIELYTELITVPKD